MKNKPGDIPYFGVNQAKIADLTMDCVQPEALDDFLHLISERYNIHLKRDVEHLDPPYTDDPILKHFRFTNVRRELDRNTKWVIEHVCHNSRLKFSHKVLNIILFRVFNKIHTAELLGIPIADPRKIDVEAMAQHVEQSYSKDETPFTGAYLCSGMKLGFKHYTGSDDSVQASLLLLQDMTDHRIWHEIEQATDPAGVIDCLQAYPGLSDFMSYQIFVDLTYTPEFRFSENEFTIAGPGARSGCKWLFKPDMVKGYSHEELIFWLRDHWKELNQYNTQNGFIHTVNPIFLFTDLPEYDRCMNVMSLENCLCEFSKYEKALHEVGRPRQVFKGTKY